MGMLNDQVVVVTGAGRGIGRAIALALSGEGAAIVVNDLGTSATGEGTDGTPAQEVVDEIKALGGQAVASLDSVATWDSAHAIVDTAVKHFGRIDGVVNNAGIVRDGIFHKMAEADWDAVISVHLKGAFNMSRAAAEHFKTQQSGFLIHMSSSTGLVGNIGQANYGAAKLALVGLSKCIALDMKRYNVRSNCIAPAAATRMTATIPADQVDRLARIALMGAEKVAPVAVALASSDVTGQVFFVRRNEISLMSQSRPVRQMQTSDGWTTRRILDEVFPAFRSDFYPLEQASDVFSWDPA
jgi:NAD(P)-dependent dehydrogenase (short-subunit alcohol dehydrogenase family)